MKGRMRLQLHNYDSLECGSHMHIVLDTRFIVTIIEAMQLTVTGSRRRVLG